jgi:hypothetical protein
VVGPERLSVDSSRATRYGVSVLSPDVRFEGFTCEDWQRVLELFHPQRPAGRPRDPNRPRGLIVALHQGGKLRKLLHSRVGRLRLDDLATDWPVTPDELARRHDSSWAMIIELGALDDVMSELGRRLERHDDYTAQWLTLFQEVQGQIDAGRIQLWPERLAHIPLPTKPMVERTLDMVCPPGKTMLIGLFDRDELWTSIALRRTHAGIDLILGPDELRPRLGLLSGDFRRDHRHLARLVSESAGELSLGCFAEHQTFKSLEVDPTPGAWAVAVAVRDVVLHPVPAAMALPLGLDAGRAAFSALRDVATRVGVAAMLSPAFEVIRDVTLGDRALEDVLGFNPMAVLRALLSRDE